MFANNGNNGLYRFLSGSRQQPFNETRRFNPAAIYVMTVLIYVVVQAIMDVGFLPTKDPLWPTVFATAFLTVFSLAYFIIGVSKGRVKRFALSDRERRSIHILMCFTILCFAMIQVIYWFTLKEVFLHNFSVFYFAIAGTALLLGGNIIMIEYFRRHRRQYAILS